MIGKIIILVIVYAIYWTSYNCILKDSEKKDREQIKTNGRLNATETVLIRKRVHNRRRSLIISILCVSSIIFATIIVLSDKEILEGPFVECVGVWFFCFFFGCFIFSFPILNNTKLGESMIGNVSLLSLNDVLSSNKPFFLYLRGFDFDDKRTLTEIIDNPYSEGFSEYAFVKGLKRRVKRVYAVGKPEETDSPWGATRVYLDNDTWRDDILILMEKANAIFIRVCSTDDCGWELDKAVSLFSNKTALVIDSIGEYNEVRGSLSHNLPEIHEVLNGWTVILISKQTNNQWDIKKLKKRKRGYVKVSNSSDYGKPSFLLPYLRYIVLLAIIILFFLLF